MTLGAEPIGEPEGRHSPKLPVRLIADRAAVLVAGLVTGFAVGMCFAPRNAPLPLPGAPVSAGPASQQVDGDRRVDPRVVRRVMRSGVITVGVFGDSFGVGIWGALYALLPASDGYRVLRFAREATGFTRYRVDNIEEDAKAEVAATPIDVAVISLGVNDAQDMWEGKLYPFMSDGWKHVVGARVDGLVSVARSTGAHVVWVGLPAMRDPQLDARVQALNAFFAARMAQLGVPFIDTRPLSVDSAGRYESHLSDARTGRPELVRTGDGIHMIGIGYQRILAKAVTDIREHAARARAAAGHHREAPAS